LKNQRPPLFFSEAAPKHKSYPNKYLGKATAPQYQRANGLFSFTLASGGAERWREWSSEGEIMSFFTLRRFAVISLLLFASAQSGLADTNATETETGAAAPTTEDAAKRNPAAEVPERAPVPASTSSTQSKILKNSIASYTMWVTGPSLQAIDGKTGEGSLVNLDQFAKLGYRVSSKWSVAFTQHWTNTVREASGNKDNLVWNNPYLTASNSNITQSTRYGTRLAGYVRYYLPFSKSSADNVGKRVDTKNGVLRVVLDPTKTFLDGALTVSGAVYVNRLFAGAVPDASVSEQRDWRIYLYPRVTYELTSKFQPYLAYYNDLEHVRLDKTRAGAGRWQKFNNKHNLELGFDWQPLARLNLNPYLEYGPTFVPRNMSVNLIAEYAFL
jgi:hypothetical protein